MRYETWTAATIVAAVLAACGSTTQQRKLAGADFLPTECSPGHGCVPDDCRSPNLRRTDQDRIEAGAKLIRECSRMLPMETFELVAQSAELLITTAKDPRFQEGGPHHLLGQGYRCAYDRLVHDEPGAMDCERSWLAAWGASIRAVLKPTP
jgi:hypothetical protein